MTTITMTFRAPHDGTLAGKRTAAQAIFRESLGIVGLGKNTEITETEVVGSFEVSRDDWLKFFNATTSLLYTG